MVARPKPALTVAKSAADSFPDAVAGLEGDLSWALRAVSLSFAAFGTDPVLELPQGPRGYLVLIAVSLGHSPSQLAMAKQLRIDKTAMTYLLDDLERAGLVTRSRGASDRRVRVVKITPVGARALQRVRERLAEVEAQLLAPLSAEEAQTFRTLLSRIAQSLPRPE